MFARYFSLTNHYMSKDLSVWIENNPRLQNLMYEVSEKIHGANFSILITSNGNVSFAKRSGLIEEKEKFYDWNKVFDRDVYKQFVENLTKHVVKNNVDIQLFGELFGANIQKGVFYGDEKNFRWFSLKINGEYVSPKDADEFLKDFMEFKVPVLGVFSVNGDVKKFIECVNHTFQSKLTPTGYEKKNRCEGIVIKPYEEVVKHNSDYFIVKKKNDEFKEVSSAKKVVVESEIVSGLSEIIVNYVNENRTESLFSKFGQLESKKDLPKYIKLYLDDVVGDFTKDHSQFNELEKKDQKIITQKACKKISVELFSRF